MKEIHAFLSLFGPLVALTLLPSSAAFQPTTPKISPGTASQTKSLPVSTSLLPEEVYGSPDDTAATSQSPLLGTTRPAADSGVQLLSYEHDGYTLKYRYKPAAPGKEDQPPLLLVHPVGIGMSSWFWDALLDEWNDGGAVYAPDLIGCGIDHGSDAWVPEEKGMFFPLSWVKGCETLLQEIILPQQQQWNSKNSNPLLAPFTKSKNKNNPQVTAVTQGGLAPVGVMLASRNPETISHLVMTSPPTWDDMTVPVPEAELEKNYNFLRSRLGGTAFGALESEWAIRFFSNLFLFENKADPKWMQQCLAECQYQEARPPIQAFNAGLMQHRSYLEELTSLTVPTTIVQGKGDSNRIPQRQEYATEMKDCKLVTLPRGLNVLPWECPELFMETLQTQQR